VHASAVLHAAGAIALVAAPSSGPWVLARAIGILDAGMRHEPRASVRAQVVALQKPERSRGNVARGFGQERYWWARGWSIALSAVKKLRRRRE
jgi:hypothetical protein